MLLGSTCKQYFNFVALHSVESDLFILLADLLYCVTSQLTVQINIIQ